ncbi:MAG: 4-hydroxy-tetrahydrodipicolinate synthase [Defluviitaleaceae bacterium]|nr:4-hydroxy-tetrahydrodipicolinate synthase [Defluviitaleaceae bacterium]
MLIFKGCGVAITTPFNEDGDIDFASLKNHIEYLIENKVDSIISCGTTGESATLTTDEKIEITKFIIKQVNKRVPVIAGSGGNNTKVVIELSKELEKIGVNALMVVTPFYNKATQKGLVNHYTEIANSVEIPILLYNVPSRTGLNISPSTVYELSKIKNIIGIKEASSNISQIAEIFSLCGKDFYVYAGNDDQVVPMLAFGAVGVISTIANIIPHDMHNIVEYFENDRQKSVDIQLNMISLIQAIFNEINPIPVKYALNKMGIIKPYLRAPLYDMEEENQKILFAEMEKYGLI